MNNNLVIKRKHLQGVDGHQVFSIRLKNETVKKLNEIAKSTNRSRNEIISIIIDYGLSNYEYKY